MVRSLHLILRYKTELDQERERKSMVSGVGTSSIIQNHGPQIMNEPQIRRLHSKNKKEKGLWTPHLSHREGVGEKWGERTDDGLELYYS